MSTFDPAPVPEERAGSPFGHGAGLPSERGAAASGRSGDLDLGAFSEHGPWVLDPEQIPWRWEIDRLRRGTRHEVPRLLSPRVSVRPVLRLLRTVTAIGGAVAGWLVFEYRRPSSRAGISRRLRVAFEHLGSSYVKLGQIISGGEGLFPDELVTEFKLLRDQVPPEPFDATSARWSRSTSAVGSKTIFAEFDEQPDRRRVDRAGPCRPPASPARKSW